MKKRILGDTGILVSPVGLGTVKWGRNTQVKYPQSFKLPNDAEINDLLAVTKECGINFLDTAPAYGTSEERLGQLLTNRHEWVLCSKAGEEFSNNVSSYDFSPNNIQQSVERSLRRLKTDYLDILLLHSNGEDEVNILSQALPQLENLKQAGKIRSFGISSKTIAGGKLGVETCDVVMLTYNLVEKFDEVIINYAALKNKGVLIKKALVSGHLDKIVVADPIQASVDFIFATHGVTSIVIGTINPSHLQYNVECIKRVNALCKST